MEAMLLYLLKSSGLIAVFYVAYHFLVRKETFFNSNRWFLLTGLLTSLLLPLFFIKKIILIEKPKFSTEDLIAYAQTSTKPQQIATVVEAFDWFQLFWVSYLTIASIFLLKIVFDLYSLYRMLHKQQVIRNEKFKLVNLHENIAPFSFFNYIVFNSSFYSEEELQSILCHEKIHSQEKHSFDIIVVKVFCAAFWFNPFMWLYKKGITQNLEYIADQKTIEQLEDKKSYQRALLKVVSHQNCLSITNNFYQSLIKKRIVMLNKNQSHKRNSWKYTLVIPALIAFVFLFQVKLIAQEKEQTAFTRRSLSTNEVQVIIHKNSTDAEMKKDAALLKEQFGVTLKCTKVKRNNAGEITGIKVEFKDKNRNKGVTQVESKEPIQPIHFYKNEHGIGFGTRKQVQISVNRNLKNNNNEDDIALNDNIEVNPDIDLDFNIEVPEPTEAPEAIESSIFPEHFWNDANTETKIIIKKEDQQPLVILNGKVIEGDANLISKKELDEIINSSIKSNTLSYNGNENQKIIAEKDLANIRSEAIKNARIQIKKMRPILQKQIRIKNGDWRKVKEEMETSQSEIDEAKAEMMQAREEMMKAKAEMEAAKAELEKEKAAMKKKK